MGEEPQLPMIPDLGEVLDRKKNMVEKISTVLKCSSCKAKYNREFKPGDYTFKKLTDEKCKECDQEKTLSIQEIFSEWVKPKKK